MGQATKEILRSVYHGYTQDVAKLDRALAFLHDEDKQEALVNTAIQSLQDGNPKFKAGSGHNIQALKHIYPMILDKALRDKLLLTITDRCTYRHGTDIETYWNDIRENDETLPKP